MCELFSADEVGEMQRRMIQGAVGADGQGVQEHLAQQPAGQLPQIVGPDALDRGALDEVAEAGIDAGAPAREIAAQARPGIRLAPAERSQ